MTGRYEAVKPPRFEIEQGLGGGRIRIRARRNIAALLFLPFWLFFWTIAGFAVIADVAKTANAEILLWLALWALGWLAAAGILGWMISGAELVGVTGRDLEVAQTLFDWKRSRLYRGRDVRNLSACEAPPLFAQMQLSIPILMKPRWGAVKFGYGGLTIYAAQGLDEAEGRMIVERLLRRLPEGAGG